MIRNQEHTTKRHVETVSNLKNHSIQLAELPRSDNNTSPKKTKVCGLSLRANYTVRALAACRRN
jgi:hypothetical protein